MGLINCILIYPSYLWVYFKIFDYWNLTSSGQIKHIFGLQRRSCFHLYPLHLHLQLTTTVISKEECPPTLCDVYLHWKLKHWLCHKYYYYIVLTYVSLKPHVDRIVLCVAKNIFSFEGVTTNHKSTIHLLFVCFWLLLFYSNINTAFYHFLCAYPVVLNMLVSLIMCYIILSHVIDFYCCIRLLNGYREIYTLVVWNCCWLKYLARRWIGIE